MIKRKTMAWFGGLATAAVTVTAFLVSSAADRRWNQWSVQTDALQKRLFTTDVRPVLYGTSTPGRAWDAYAAAVVLAKADKGLEKQVRPYVREKLDPSQLTALLGAHAKTLAQLHRGAHCLDALDPIDWSQDLNGAVHSLLMLRGLSNLAVTQALAQIESGQPVAAVETLLDAAQLGRDAMHSPVMINEMIGAAVFAISTYGAVEGNDLLDRLSPAALDRFADGLAILDEHIAKVSPSLHGEVVLFARLARNHPELVAKMGRSTQAWRYGFSTRLMLADAGLQMMELADRTSAAARGPWITCDAHLSGIEEKVIEAANPVLSAMAWSLGNILRTRFQTIARLRLLRMAIEHRRGRPVPKLADPFGDTLRHEVGTESKARFWSVGPEGSRKLFLFRPGS